MYTSGINTNICKIVAPFFADDGMILVQTLQEAKENIQILSNIAKDCGLSIYKNKSNIIIFNSKNQPEYIEDIPITTSITYLGVNINNKKDCYQLQRTEATKRAKKYSSMMPAIIAKSWFQRQQPTSGGTVRYLDCKLLSTHPSKPFLRRFSGPVSVCSG